MEKFDSKKLFNSNYCIGGGGGGVGGSASSPHTSGSTPVNFEIFLSPKVLFWMNCGTSLSLQPKYFCTNSEQTNTDWPRKNWDLLNDVPVIFYINL